MLFSSSLAAQVCCCEDSRFGDMKTRRHRDERGVEPPQVNWWLLKISVNPYKMRPAPRVVYPGDNYLRQKSPEFLIIAAEIWVWPLEIRHLPHHRDTQGPGERSLNLENLMKGGFVCLSRQYSCKNQDIFNLVLRKLEVGCDWNINSSFNIRSMTFRSPVLFWILDAKW